MIYDNIILGSGPSGIQLAYYFEKYNINYIILEKNNISGSFFENYPHSKELISINKKFTGNTNEDFNLRHDWNSLLNNEKMLFTDYTNKFYPKNNYLVKYLNDFKNNFKLKVKYNTNIIEINNFNNLYVLKDSENNIYKCNKLIVATGLQKKNIPNFLYIDENIKNNSKHYLDFPKDYFINESTLKKYENKKIIIIGIGNSSFELANILNDYCCSILILGKNKNDEYLANTSIVTKYTGSLRSKYLGFLDTFSLKSLNGIMSDEGTKPENIAIIEKNNKIKIFFLGNTRTNLSFCQYDKNNIKNLIDTPNKMLDTDYTCNNYDEIIYCTGTSFDDSIFNFNIDKSINNKFPKINQNYESTNNTNLYFIGSLMHSLDYKVSSGGFIHGFRYLIKLFMNLNYNIPYEIKEFKFNMDLKIYKELAEYIHNRVSITSSLYQMHSVLCDAYYFDKDTNKIIYYHDIKETIINKCIKKNVNITTITLKFGKIDNFDIQKLYIFDRKSPKFLHISFNFLNLHNNNLNIQENLLIEEHLFADFSGSKYYDKIYNAVKMSKLIL